MTTLESGDVRIEVTEPVAQPYRFGLFSVATPSPITDPHWQAGGVEWVSEMCSSPVAVTTNDCVDPDVAALDVQVACVIPQFSAFTVYSSVGDSVGKFRNVADAMRVARDRLTTGEQFGVEAALWALLEAAEPTPVAASTLALGLGLVEQMLAEAYGALGVIHMSRLAATLYGDILRVDGTRLVTPLGTPVVAGGGYDEVDGTEPTTISIFGTGPLFMLRSDIDDRINAINRETNTHFVVAQRTYTIGYDCGVVGTTVTV
jgi:hypothetical protein